MLAEFATLRHTYWPIVVVVGKNVEEQNVNCATWVVK